MESTSNLENAAILISLLPAIDAEQLLQRMPNEEASAIRQRTAGCEASWENRRAAFREFMREMSGGPSGAHRFRVDKAQSIPSFHFLSRLRPSRVADVLEHEMPRTTATVLSALPATRAADVMSLLPEEYQSDVVHHMLCSVPIQNDVLCDLAQSLMEVLSDERADDVARQEGRCRVAALLQCTDAQTRQRLMEVAKREGIDLEVE